MHASRGTHTTSQKALSKLPFHQTRRQPGLATKSALVTSSPHLQETSFSDCGVLGIRHCLHSGIFPFMFGSLLLKLCPYRGRLKQSDMTEPTCTHPLPSDIPEVSAHFMREGFQHLIPRVVLERIWVTFEGCAGGTVRRSGHCGSKMYTSQHRG